MRRETILVHAGEERRKIVRVDVRAARDLRRRAADRLAVLADRRAGVQRPQCELVAARDGIGQIDRHAFQLHALAGREIAQGDSDVVARGDAIAGRQGGGGAVHGDRASYPWRKPVSVSALPTGTDPAQFARPMPKKSATKIVRMPAKARPEPRVRASEQRRSRSASSASTPSTTSRVSRTCRRRPCPASSTSRRSCARRRAPASRRSSSASASRRTRRRARSLSGARS